MANIQSAKKRARQNIVRRERNRIRKSRVRTAVRAARESIESKNVEEAKEDVKYAIIELRKAQKVGVIHMNNMSRRVSRLQTAFNAIAK